MNMLDWTEETANELLKIGTGPLRFAPIPGLEEAARTLLGIWDALETIDVSPCGRRHACDAI